MCLYSSPHHYIYLKTPPPPPEYTLSLPSQSVFQYWDFPNVFFYRPSIHPGHGYSTVLPMMALTMLIVIYQRQVCGCLYPAAGSGPWPFSHPIAYTQIRASLWGRASMCVNTMCLYSSLHQAWHQAPTHLYSIDPGTPPHVGPNHMGK